MLDNKQLGAIHIAKKDAALTDLEYRNLLFEIAGVTSAKYLSEDGYQAVMRAIRDRQYSPPRQKFEPPQTPLEKKVWKLWYLICDYLPERERTARYLFGFIHRVVNDQSIQVLSDMNNKQFHKVIEALNHRWAQEIAQDNVNAKNNEVPF
jgi:hypothetical protein